MAETDVTTYEDAGKPDRRGLLRSMAAMPLLISPAFALRDEEDAELLALEREWEAAYAAHLDACKTMATAEDSGDEAAIKAASRMQGDACERAFAVEQRILDTPARSIRGLATKAKVIARNAECDMTRESDDLVRNVLALVGKPEALT